MNNLYVQFIAGRMQVASWQVENCVALFEEGATVPFISRYRKEKTGGMDDASVAEVKHWVDTFAEMEKRKETVLSTISEAGALTDELRSRIENCVNSTELEDIYLPFRPKRRTRATAAKELGLEPLADIIWSNRTRDLAASVKPFVKGKVASAEDALAGARDIIAERLSETAVIRENLRAIYRNRRIESFVTKAGRDSRDADTFPGRDGNAHRKYFVRSPGGGLSDSVRRHPSLARKRKIKRKRGRSFRQNPARGDNTVR